MSGQSYVLFPFIVVLYKSGKKIKLFWIKTFIQTYKETWFIFYLFRNILVLDVTTDVIFLIKYYYYLNK